MAHNTIFSVATFNAGLCSFRYFGKTWVETAGFLDERFALMPDALQQTGADIICLQEVFNRDWRRDLRRELAASLQQTHAYAAIDGPSGRWHSPNQGPGLGIFSRRPLLTHSFTSFDASNIVERLFVHKGFQVVTFDLLGVGTVRLINTHTVAGKYPESDANEHIRHLQQEQILQVLDRDPYDVDMLMGDFNHDVAVSRTNYQQILDAGFVDTFLAAGGHGYSWDLQNPFNHAGPHGHCPSQRVDHVFVRDRGRLQPIKAAIVLDEPCVRVGDDGRVTLSDHYGVQVWFEITS